MWLGELSARAGAGRRDRRRPVARPSAGRHWGAREEAAAFDELLSACELVDGFRFFHPAARSATCWAQKAKGKPEQREHWKRYDYALVSKSLVQPAAGRSARLACRLLDVRHRGEVFEAGRPVHVPVESLFAGDI